MTRKEGSEKDSNVRAPAESAAKSGPPKRSEIVELHPGHGADHRAGADGGGDTAEVTLARPSDDGADGAARLINPAAIAIVSDGRRQLDESKIPSFVASIDEHPQGLTNPITVTWDDTLGAWRLVAGLHRLTGWRQSSKAGQPIPARVVAGDPDTLFIIEFEENAVRVELTPLDQLKQGRKAELIYKKRALERQRRHGGTAPGKQASEGGGEKGRVRDLVAAGLGVSGRSWDYLKAVGDAVDREPAVYGKLIPILQEEGIKAAWKELDKMKRRTCAPGSKVIVSTEDRQPAHEREPKMHSDRLVRMVNEKISPRLQQAIQDKGHVVQVAPSGERLVCECGAQFYLPHCRGDLVGAADEQGALISAHWEKALARERRPEPAGAAP